MRKPVAGAQRGVAGLIGGDLGDDEFIVGAIGVEAVDDPIAVSEAAFVIAILFKDIAFGVRVAGDIEPVAAPTFAEAR